MIKFKRLLFLILFCTVTIVSNSQDSKSKPTIKVSGEVTTPLTLSIEDLAKMNTIETSMKDKAGTEHLYKGVDLKDILRRAGVTMDKELRGANLSKYLLVKCADNYKVLFSLAELDSSFTDRIATLAYESDGKPLPAGVGPFRLVVPGEKKAARSGYQVVELVVNFAKE